MIQESMVQANPSLQSSGVVQTGPKFGQFWEEAGIQVWLRICGADKEQATPPLVGALMMIYSCH